MITRRDFLGRAATGLAWMGLASSVEGLGGLLGDAGAADRDSGEVVVTILHTNDVHSRIDPFPERSGRNAGLGGAARRATLIKRIRAENPRTLLLDAGDVFQGTPYFNLFNGEVDFKVMSALGYDAMTVGNHEFDAGIDGLEAVLRFADFSLVSTNYDFSRTILRDRVERYIIREVGPVRVGIFGLGVILKGLVPESLCRGVVYSNPLPVAREMARHLREREKCDLVICLSHLGNNGYHDEPGEQQIAHEAEEIDLIIGGHSHTFMKEPTRISHAMRETLVFQVGWAGINLGRVDFHMRAGKVVGARACAIPVEMVSCEPAEVA